MYLRHLFCAPVESLESRTFLSVSESQPIARPNYNHGAGFFVSNAKIYDANGYEFDIRGFSHTTWWGSNDIDALGEFGKTNANAVRVAFGSDFGPSQTPQQRKAIVEKLVAQGIVPIVEDHTATGHTGPEYLQKIVDRWIEPGNLQWLKQYEKQVILNIANEWGPDSTVWRDEYKTAITRLRNAGVDNLIMIDSGNNGGPGQSAHTIETWGKELLAHDPQHNIVLSIHMYNMWRTEEHASDVGAKTDGSPWDIATELKQMQADGLPFVVGEFSSDAASIVRYDSRRALEIFNNLDVGYLAWSWNQNAPSTMDMVWGWQYNSDADLKDWGKLVITDPKVGLKTVAKPASIFQSGIRGVVFKDSNRDGVRDGGEAAVQGAQVYLDANKNGRLDSSERIATTASNGSYAFGRLNPGTYVIRLVPAAGATPKSFDSVIAGVATVTIAAGANADHVNLALAGTTQQPPPPPPPPPPPDDDQTPFRHFVIGDKPTIIQAEEFDKGGEGAAYHDLGKKNLGKKYRDASVDVQNTRDAGKGYNVGWIRAGEWIEYTVHVADSGPYDIDFRVAAWRAGGNFHLEVDGHDVTGALAIPDTGRWQHWKTVGKADVDLSAGDHVLRLVMDENGASGWVGNFNYLRFAPSEATRAASNLNVVTNPSSPKWIELDPQRAEELV